MQESSLNWHKTTIWASILVGLLLVVLPALEFAKPGSMLCPLRRLAGKCGIPVSGINSILESSISPEDELWAATNAADWKEMALKRFPVLQIDSHPVPEAENGFWQMCQLEKFGHLPSTALLDIQKDLSVLDSAKANEELVKNKAWVDHLEWLASLDQASSMELPGGPVVFVPARQSKQAHDTLMLMAVLAAESGDEAKALRCIRAGAKLSEHLSNIETPTLLAETICVLFHLSRMNLIVEKILPAIGKGADLEQWQQELNRVEFTPQRLAKAIRGEWQVGCDTMVYPAIAHAHRQRMLTDPEAVAMTHAELASKQIVALQTMTLATMAKPSSSPALPKSLSPEGREMMDLIGVGSEAWTRGFTRSARVQDCHVAAMELLALERVGGKLQAHDTKRVTPDPITGSPFILDPITRELSMPSGHPEFDLHKPLKLPW